MRENILMRSKEALFMADRYRDDSTEQFHQQIDYIITDSSKLTFPDLERLVTMLEPVVLVALPSWASP